MYRRLNLSLKIHWQRLWNNPVRLHESLELELSRAWEPSHSSQTSPLSEGKEAYISVPHGDKNVPKTQLDFENSLAAAVE
jgi:hypothetical protein